jgi:hypothetical protein
MLSLDQNESGGITQCSKLFPRPVSFVYGKLWATASVEPRRSFPSVALVGGKAVKMAAFRKVFSSVPGHESGESRRYAPSLLTPLPERLHNGDHAAYPHGRPCAGGLGSDRPQVGAGMSGQGRVFELFGNPPLPLYALVALLVEDLRKPARLDERGCVISETCSLSELLAKLNPKKANA